MAFAPPPPCVCCNGACSVPYTDDNGTGTALFHLNPCIMEISTRKNDVVLDYDGIVYGAIYAERNTEKDGEDVQSDFVTITMESITNGGKDVRGSFKLTMTPEKAAELATVLIGVSTGVDTLPFTN